MCIREMVEEQEGKRLSPFATLSSSSKGRTVRESEDEIRTAFAVDRDRIIHSNAFRRLSGKTQVFILPMMPPLGNDHYMTRMTHTLETAQVARSMAVALGLNETLAEAIMLAHDLAHTAFGHAGEEALNAIFGYEHEASVVRRIEHLEKRNGNRGLNLSWEVLDGASNHSGFDNKPRAATMEGKLAPFADKIAYLVSDMDNAIQAGIITDVPQDIKNRLGQTKGQMMDTMIKDIIKNSGLGEVRMSGEVFDATSCFREFMFKNVYFSDVCRRQAEKVHKIVEDLYHHLRTHPSEIPSDYDDAYVGQNAIDYIASMTDQYAIELYKKVFFV